VSVVMTHAGEFSADGRVAGIAHSWAKRLPAGSVGLAVAKAEAPPSEQVPNSVRLLPIACPDYWILDCGTYTASIYLGHYGLRQMLRLHPKAWWFLICDDDVYLNPYALGKVLRGLNHGVAVCIGAHERRDRQLLSYWSGIVCSNAAVRLLDQHLLGATREVVRLRLGYSAGDFIISKCLRDLGVPLVHVDGFFGGNWPLPEGMFPPPSAVTFHRTVRRQDFEALDWQLHKGLW